MLTTKEIAERLAVTEQSVRRWRMLGQGPPWYQIGGVVRYDEIAFNAWLEANKQETKTGNQDEIDHNETSDL